MSHPAPHRIKLVPPNPKRTARIYGVTKRQQKLITELIEADIARKRAMKPRKGKRSPARGQVPRGSSTGRPKTVA